jgi:tRNA threonylcarbamoyladenosine biosynthesis protein TsaE
MATRTAGELVLTSRSPESTMALAARLAAVAEPGDLLCLWGELGAGKTVFAKGFGAGLGVAATINSPSFVLMAEHAGRLPLFHLDLYRLAGPADVLEGGLLDDRQSAGVTLIEWPERLGESLPAPRLDVRIDGAAEDERRIALIAIGPTMERYVRAARP